MKFRGSRGRLGEVADKSATSPRLPRDVSDLSRGSRGRLGEVRVMEFGLYQAVISPLSPHKQCYCYKQHSGLEV